MQNVIDAVREIYRNMFLTLRPKQWGKNLANEYRHSGLNIRTVRPGYVFAKLSMSFNPTSFSLYPKNLAPIVGKTQGKNREIISVPTILKILPLLKLIPRVLFVKVINN